MGRGVAGEQWVRDVQTSGKTVTVMVQGHFRTQARR